MPVSLQSYLRDSVLSKQKVACLKVRVCILGSSTQTFFCATSMTPSLCPSLQFAEFPPKVICSKNIVCHTHGQIRSAGLQVPFITLSSGNNTDWSWQSRTWWSLSDFLYILSLLSGESKCGSVPSTLCRPLGKSIVHLIGFLDAGSMLSFLPAEMSFTWQS